LRRATEPAEVGGTLQSLALEAGARADALNDPDLFLIGAEALALRAQYCEPDSRGAAPCRATTHTLRGEHLFDAGRWRGDARLLRASIAAYRQALRDTPSKSAEWITLHARLGDALAQLSERDGEERRGLLRQALDEYALAQPSVDPTERWTIAMFDQNICSIRQPLAALDQDRVDTRRAIDECEKARVYYAEVDDKSSEAAAHYNMARALEKLADWDQDEESALAAVEHVRRAVALYTEDRVTLSVAFGRVHLADALTDASAFAARRTDGESQIKSRAMRDEARASLAAAEPVLRDAKAAGYLASLERVRRRLEAAR
jgi:tetratricopeptide (TPR) repeat protein